MDDRMEDKREERGHYRQLNGWHWHVIRTRSHGNDWRRNEAKEWTSERNASVFSQ